MSSDESTLAQPGASNSLQADAAETPSPSLDINCPDCLHPKHDILLSLENRARCALCQGCYPPLEPKIVIKSPKDQQHRTKTMVVTRPPTSNVPTTTRGSVPSAWNKPLCQPQNRPTRVTASSRSKVQPMTMRNETSTESTAKKQDVNMLNVADSPSTSTVKTTTDKNRAPARGAPRQEMIQPALVTSPPASKALTVRNRNAVVMENMLTPAASPCTSNVQMATGGTMNPTGTNPLLAGIQFGRFSEATSSPTPPRSPGTQQEVANQEVLEPQNAEAQTAEPETAESQAAETEVAEREAPELSAAWRSLAPVPLERLEAMLSPVTLRRMLRENSLILGRPTRDLPTQPPIGSGRPSSVDSRSRCDKFNIRLHPIPGSDSERVELEESESQFERYRGRLWRPFGTDPSLFHKFEENLAEEVKWARLRRV